MRKVSPQTQRKIKSNVDQSSDLLTTNLEKIASNKWTELSTVSETVKRLKRKGHRSQAEQYIGFDEMRNNKTVLENIDPDIIKEADRNEPEKINQIVKEGIVGSDDMMPSYFLHKGSKVARSVGRISNKSNREALGTGFLISPHLIMTNNHVIPDKPSARNAIIEFDYFADNSGNPIAANEFELLPDVLFFTSAETAFDFSIIAIEPKNNSEAEVKQFGWIQLIEETGKAHIGERLNIIHHPLGKPQHISIRKNLLVTHEESKVYLKYMTDTEPGSSGSPVLNDEWELVALHRASEVIADDNQKQLYFQAMRQIDKNLAQELKNKEVVINFGVRISAISNHIKSQIGSHTLEEQKLLREIFNGEKSDVEPVPIIISDGQTEERNYDNEGNPMHININIGNKNYGNASGEPPISISHDRPTELRLREQLEIYNRNINSQKSVFKALGFLEEARAERYLPVQEEIDQIKEEYYEDVLTKLNGPGLSKKQFYDQLHTLLSDTLKLVDAFPNVTSHLERFNSEAHLESLSLESGGVTYAKARAHLYTWVDLQENRMLKGVYTQAIISPEQLLLKDLIQSLKIEGVELPRRFKNNQFLNCEHIVPKSLFNNDRIGFSDLHHLITAEGATNTFRNNRPYRQFGLDEGQVGPTNLISYIDKGGKIKDDFFEPKNNKALVARATLYFLVCHKQKLPKTVYDEAAVNTLIAWSKSQLPNSYELHRNESIFKLQGNRNPFIDFPDWVNKVDFMQGLRD